MKNHFLVLCLTSLISVAHANDTASWTPKHKPLSATYLLYAGEPGERAPPTSQDRKLAISITGGAAAEIFNSIGPDASATCTTEKGERLRAKGEIWCSYRPRTGYKCYLGFDLRTGEPHAGTSC